MRGLFNQEARLRVLASPEQPSHTLLGDDY
jgi:hypothetical protein